MTEPKEETTMTENRDVISRIAKVIEDLPAIGKDQRNAQQNFNFRGIDDIMAAVKPLLAKHEVVVIPQVLERKDDVRTTKSGNSMYVVLLHVQFTFHAPGGSSVVASGWGEGTDSGDKATNKAMTGAFKYVLVQVFAIADADTQDADKTTPEPSDPRDVTADSAILQRIDERMATLAEHGPVEVKEALWAEWKELAERGDLAWPISVLTAPQAVVAIALLNKYESAQSGEPSSGVPSPGEEPEIGPDGWAATPEQTRLDGGKG